MQIPAEHIVAISNYSLIDDARYRLLSNVGWDWAN
jgi:hypothetical protein